jgi:hypothetical protein
MNMHRPAALALAACAAVLSLAACSSSATTAASTGSTATSGAASSPAGTVRVGGALGSFPIPSGATVVDNIASGKQIEILIGSVSPKNAASFYTSALPQAGYTVSTNTLASSGSDSALGIEFTGHGYKGLISAASNVKGVALGNPGSKDVLAIVLTQQ